MDFLRSPQGQGGPKPSRRSSLTQQTGLLQFAGAAQRVARKSQTGADAAAAAAAGAAPAAPAPVPSRVQVRECI